MSSQTKQRWCLAFLVCALSAGADVLELKNGTVLNGKYIGGTAGTVRFETPMGTQVVEVAQINALTFTGPAAVAAAPIAAAAPAGAPAPTTPVASAGPVTVPAGTMLLVRMMDPVSSKNSAGANFTTKLEADLTVNNVVVAPAGTPIYGKIQSASQAGRLAGKSSLDLRLAQMVLGSTTVPLSTSNYKQAGANSLRKTAGGAAAGAAIGAVVDGGDGAGKGAAIGATASLLKKGETVTVPPGTLLEFTLTQPITIAAH